MKSYTDLKQSKQLAEILPVESADMWWREVSYGFYHIEAEIPKGWYDMPPNGIPCWSLSALLDILPYPQLSKDKLGSGKEGWMVSAYHDNCRYDSCWHGNQVDAVVEMILKLNEQECL